LATRQGYLVAIISSGFFNQKRDQLLPKSLSPKFFLGAHILDMSHPADIKDELCFVQDGRDTNEPAVLLLNHPNI
jgi:hypothetical protein